MAIMKQLWDSSEFADLNISTQNLRDQAARTEKIAWKRSLDNS